MNTELDRRAAECRSRLSQVRRLVVKIGSRVLVQRTGRPEMRRIRALVRDLAKLRLAGRELIVVTSGAIGTGMEALGMTRRPARLPQLQMAAAVGQSRLMARYDKLFSAYGIKVGQVLLTHDDLKHRHRHLNARNTLLAMLEAGIVPIVNENDAVAVEEIKFGDNDLLASLVAHLVNAELLMLLTTVDGLRAPTASGRTRRVKCVAAIDKGVIGLASGKGGEISTGGMASKLASARTVAGTGTNVVIADGRRPGVIAKVMAGADVGTLVLGRRPSDGSKLSGRKRWLAFFHKPVGMLLVDDGARAALLRGGRSLLPIGIRAVEGDFNAGACVDIAGLDRRVFARGLSNYASADILRVMGRRTEETPRVSGSSKIEEVVHCDNMAMLEPSLEN